MTFAMSSILSTSACGVGTQTTSLPGWPTRGSNCAAGLVGVAAAWANAAAANKNREQCQERLTEHLRYMHVADS